MLLRFIIHMLRRMASKSPKLFAAIQWLSFGTAVVCGGILILSWYGIVILPNQDRWDKLIIALMSSGMGSGLTGSVTTKDPQLIADEVKKAISEDKRLY